MLFQFPFYFVAFKRSRHPLLRVAISKLNHRINMTESENTLTETYSTVKHGGRFIDRTGQKFGRLLVLSFVGKNKFGHLLWKTKCDCGNEKTVAGNNMVQGMTLSCGCLKVDAHLKSHLTHGACHTREYRIWSNMKNRCSNSNCNRWHIYGGRGIKVCDRWRNSFESFLADMGKSPTGMSIERVDTDGHYEPSNCRWATPKEQANNMRCNRVLTVNGISKNLAEWAVETGINASTILKRINQHGWTVELAVLTPVKRA